jgi:hypothetical protein
METVHSLKSNLAYLKQLFGAGLEGVGSARREIDGRVFTSPLPPVAWTHAAIGAMIGMLSTRVIRNGKSAPKMATGGLIGSVLGLGAGLAWASRGLIRPAARTTVRRVNAIRDARWLETHPINYA